VVACLPSVCVCHDVCVYCQLYCLGQVCTASCIAWVRCVLPAVLPGSGVYCQLYCLGQVCTAIARATTQGVDKCVGSALTSAGL
jgi:hypothetical protein